MQCKKTHDSLKSSKNVEMTKSKLMSVHVLLNMFCIIIITNSRKNVIVEYMRIDHTFLKPILNYAFCFVALGGDNAKIDM